MRPLSDVEPQAVAVNVPRPPHGILERLDEHPGNPVLRVAHGFPVHFAHIAKDHHQFLLARAATARRIG